MRLLRIVTALVAAVGVLAAAPGLAQSPAAPVAPATTDRADSHADRPNVLVVMPVQPGRSMFDALSRGIVTEFLRAPAPVAVSFEHLFDVTVAAEISSRQLEFVRAKYAGQQIDIVIAIAHPRQPDIREVLGLSDRVPIVVVAERATRVARPPNSVLLDLTSTAVDSYRYLRPLFAEGHEVALIGGAAPSDRSTNDDTLEALRADLGAARVHDFSTLPVREMRHAIEALPDDAVLVMGSVLTDREQRPITVPLLLSAVLPDRNRPVVVLNDVLLGQGALGGALYKLDDVGAEAARVALRLLGGSSADAEGTRRLSPSGIVDARQLAQLGLAADRIPPDASVINRQPTLWEAYGHWVVGVAVLVGLQTLLIAGLVAERRRRRESQARLAERLRLQAVVAEISSEFTNLRADHLDASIRTSLARVGEALGLDACAVFTLGPGHETPRLVSRWPIDPRCASSPTIAEAALLTWARPRLEQRYQVHVRDMAARARDGRDRVSHRDAVLFLPLAVDDHVIGVLSLQHPSSQAWSPHVLGDLRTIGEIVATAVVRMRVDASMRRQLEVLAHLNRVASLGELAASLAHELNQPLAAILSNAEAAAQLLEHEPTPLDELREILADVIADDERAGRIIGNVRAMLRRREVEAVPLDVNAVAAEITRLAAHDARLRSGDVSVLLGAGLPAVLMDGTQLKQVLLNLVLNGVDAMASLHVRRPVEVATRARDGGVVLEVRDHGPGIPDAVLPRLFDPFFTTKADGLGVGLAITRSIVEAAGGRISAANAAGGGAAFTVWLPAAASRPAAAHTHGEAAPAG